MTTKNIAATLLLILGVPPVCLAQTIAIVGATLIDVSNYGHSTNDILLNRLQMPHQLSSAFHRSLRLKRNPEAWNDFA
jgi:hypothetical protein